MLPKKIDYERGGALVYVNDKPLPVMLLEMLAEMKVGSSVTLTREDVEVFVTSPADAPPAKAKPSPRSKGDEAFDKAKAKAEKALGGKVSMKKMKCIWPPKHANAPFPEKLKVDGKAPDEALDENEGEKDV